MNKKIYIVIGILVLIAIGFFIAKGKITGNTILEDSKLSEGFTEKCLDCSKGPDCPNYGNCKGESNEGSCGEHEEEICENH